MSRRHPAVVNLDALTLQPGFQKGAFRFQRASLSEATGAKEIGVGLYEVAPGHAAFPFHWHASNEESLLVLAGQGTLRIGEDRVAVGPGDYAAFPAGPGHAHQLLNTGTAPLRYLCWSTKRSPEIAGYPDSGKIGAMSPDLRMLFVAESAVDYFHGEKLAEEPDGG